MGALVYKQQVIAGGSSSSGGSIINIVTEDETLFGTTVTITATSKTYTTTFDNSGKAKVEGITDVGDITISVTDGEDTNTLTLNIPYFGNYLVNVSLKTFVEGWLESINHSTTGYDELSDVLNDEKLLRELFTRHSSVDFLVQNSLAPEIETIINNDYCAKWINLRDYALDTLYADETIGSLMDTADKYFYGEWALMPQVPKMTSDTKPYGEASGSSDSGAPSYYAFTDNFSGTTDNYANLSVTSSYPYGYLQYKFVNPIKINRVKIRGRIGASGRAILTFKIQASNDGSTFEDISDVITNVNTANGGISEYDISNSSEYSYYRFVPVTHENAPNGAQIAALQLYAWQPKGNVPVMTSNTAPYGEAFAEDNWSGFDPYKVFDGIYSTTNDSDYWAPASGSFSNGSYIGYKFINPVNIKMVSFKGTPVSLDYTYINWYESNKLQGSNDGSTWIDLGEFTQTERHRDWTLTVNNNEYYLQYRLLFSGAHGEEGNFRINQLQFYGRELKVSVPVMTSNTEPWGEASCSSTFLESTYPACNVFNPGIGSNTAPLEWLSDHEAPAWVQYDFKKNTVLKFLYIKACNDTAYTQAFTFNLYGSKDGINFDTLLENISVSAASFVRMSVPNSDYYKIYRVRVNNSNFTYYTDVGACIFDDLQLYCLDYSEYDWDSDNPTTYLFDHGVLVNSSLAFSGTASNISSAIKLIAANDEVSLTIYTTDFTLLRSVEGQYGSGTNALIAGSGSSNFGSIAGNLPYNHYLDISSINGENVVGVKQTAAGTFEVTELWLE